MGVFLLTLPLRWVVEGACCPIVGDGLPRVLRTLAMTRQEGIDFIGRQRQTRNYCWEKWAAGGTVPTREKHPSERKRKAAKRERIPTTSLRTGLGMTGYIYEDSLRRSMILLFFVSDGSLSFNSERK